MFRMRVATMGFSSLMMAVLIMQGVSAADVARTQFTTGVADREPVDAVTRVDADTRTVYFFTELRDLQNRRVVHRWEHEGRPMAEVGFDVGGPRWRVWSSKRMQPEETGTWRAYVVMDDGSVLAARELVVGAAAARAVDDTAPALVPESHFMRHGY